MGGHCFEKSVLTQYRKEVADEKSAAALLKAVGAVEKAEYEVEGEHYKRVPRGFEVEDERRCYDTTASTPVRKRSTRPHYIRRSSSTTRSTAGRSCCRCTGGWLTHYSEPFGSIITFKLAVPSHVSRNPSPISSNGSLWVIMSSTSTRPNMIKS